MAIGLALLRRDGFASVGASYDGGTLTTAPFRVDGGTLRLNVKADYGRVLVEVLDEHGAPLPGYAREDCNPVEVDGVDVPVTWRERATLAEPRAGRSSCASTWPTPRLYAYRPHLALSRWEREHIIRLSPWERPAKAGEGGRRRHGPGGALSPRHPLRGSPAPRGRGSRYAPDHRLRGSPLPQGEGPGGSAWTHLPQGAADALDGGRAVPGHLRRQLTRRRSRRSRPP